MSDIRVRIAPSPTGLLHVGTVRTALFNYLFARRHKGSFILRIEDTDIERSDPKFEKNIIDGLQWLGIESDENPVIGGPYGPYRQSERTELYKKYIIKLLENGFAFYCFHTEEELLAEKKKLLEEKHAPAHLCEFRTMEFSEASVFAQSKQNHIIRFKTPQGKIVKFDDIIRGKLSFRSDLLGDFSIAKQTNMPLYNFAVVVDDFCMNISHVIRGEDHIANTPKQILILEALGFPRPRYAHLPLILGRDRSKLSKRDGTTSIDEYKSQGYLPEAMFNFIALLGWNPGGSRELFSHDELTQEFSFEHVQKSGAVFDSVKLNWMNGEYIRKKSLHELVELCIPHLVDFLRFSVPNEQFPKIYIEQVVALEQSRLKKLSEIGERTSFFFIEPEYEASMLYWKDQDKDSLYISLNTAKKILEDMPRDIQNVGYESGFLKKIGSGDKGVILWPLRVALTGKKVSPGPFEILEILGRKKGISRIDAALRLL